MLNMFKLCNQQIKEDNYVEYKTENDKCKELKNILNYLFNLDYYFINCKSYYETYYNKKNTLYIEIENSNKIPNNITKLYIYNIKYLNNLPLYLKWLSFSYDYKLNCNCNLPPDLIYLCINSCDINNLPKSLIYLLTYTNIHNDIILNNINIKKNIFNLLYDYYNIIFNPYIIINNWYKHYYPLFYILK